jgi:hypothetical protein
MEVDGDKKSIRTWLDISPLSFHIVSKLVQALVITYDNIFQALAVEADVLLQKSFMDLTSPHPTHRAAQTRPPWTCTCLAN